MDHIMSDDLFDDDFDDARPGFVKLEDLLGRLLLIKPTGVTGERESTLRGQSGQMYEWIETDTVVLDGDVSELIESVPTVLDGFQFTGANLVGTIKPKIRTGRKVLGRLGQRPASDKQIKTLAWYLDAPTDADKDVARAYRKAHPPKDEF
jgi:hypothetical protein